VIVIDCSELSADEKLALAAQISDDMSGSVFALVKGTNIVLDALTREKPELSEVKAVVADFISRRKDGSDYSMDVSGDQITVHSADPVAALRKRRQNELPPNLKQCPYCAFVTEYEELYTVHVRAHGVGF
jgi:hypothetical protein